MARVGLAFHEGFSFVRSAVAEVLSVARSKVPGEKLDFKLLRRETTLGRNYIKAMPRYCVGAGLLDHKNELTALGRRVSEFDPHLERLETLWLCHYNLSAIEGPGPEFWHLLVANHLHMGEELRTPALGDVLRLFAAGNGNPVAERTAFTAASVFLGTYARSECLGGLCILESRDAGTYLVKDVCSPPPLVFAYVVSDYWQRYLANQTSVWIDEFNKDGGPTEVLLMGLGQVNFAMRELSRMGIATVQLTQPPFQFSPLWKKREEILDRIYGN